MGMLTLVIPGIEFYDELNNEFINYPEVELHLEHSLVSISKWESKWKKPFLSGKEKTVDEIIDYIKCMSLDEIRDVKVLNNLTVDNVKSINEYIENSMTATTFSNDKGGNSREIITSEIIYYWMLTLNIPFECQYWHLNRLLTLIRVCNIKNNPPKKMSKQEMMSRNRALNQSRKQQFNTRG